MFKRAHHQRVAQVLYALDGDLLRAHQCYFGGETVIALRFGEFRESVDIDLMVSDLASYRQLRQLLTESLGVQSLIRPHAAPVKQLKEIRADQYGIRTMVAVDDQPIKFEIVLEARISFEQPLLTDEVCGIPTLTVLDMATSKLLANTDRWADDSVFSRDLIDLAMMQLNKTLLRKSLDKSQQAYGSSVRVSLEKALQKIQSREGWLDRCMRAMNIDLPKALLQQRLVALEKLSINL